MFVVGTMVLIFIAALSCHTLHVNGNVVLSAGGKSTFSFVSGQQHEETLQGVSSEVLMRWLSPGGVVRTRLARDLASSRCVDDSAEAIATQLDPLLGAIVLIIRDNSDAWYHQKFMVRVDGGSAGKCVAEFSLATTAIDILTTSSALNASSIVEWDFSVIVRSVAVVKAPQLMAATETRRGLLHKTTKVVWLQLDTPVAAGELEQLYTLSDFHDLINAVAGPGAKTSIGMAAATA